MSAEHLASPGQYVRQTGELLAVEDMPREVVRNVTTYLFRVFSARHQVLANGHVLQEGSSYNDYYGRLTCVEEALKDALAAQEKHAVAGLEYRVLLTVGYERRVDQGEGQSDPDLPHVRFSMMAYKMLPDDPPESVHVLWSSQDPAAVHWPDVVTDPPAIDPLKGDK